MEFDSKILKVKDYQDEGVRSDRIVTLQTPSDFAFKAGQFVMIGHVDVKNKNNPSQLKWGSMSIASSSHVKGSLELVLSIGSSEGITYFVGNKCNVGDGVKLRGPFGVFGIREEFEEAVFIATGTGIAPLIAMIRELLEGGTKKKLRLFFGFKNNHKFLYAEELNALRKKYPNFSFETIASREPDARSQKQGHVQELLKEQKWNPESNIQFYICGTPTAVPDIVNLLKGVGFAQNRIHFEQW
ncbi:MAG: FAD-dependent oxidoreductase [Candidatus Diapherotrites archaeon]|nr:FAD-dependent oxidoreductase [Candidatus Diapherotrites archaeon]